MAMVELKYDCSNLSLDRACLYVTNTDDKTSVELWAQSIECYECVPWKYLTVNPFDNLSMSVNSTYATEILIKPRSSAKFTNSLIYHFTQFGTYSTDVGGGSPFNISTINYGNNEYLSLLYGVLFIFAFFIAWPCSARLLKNRQLPADLVSAGSSDRLLEEEIDTTDYETHSQPPIPPEAGSPMVKTRLKSLDTFRGLSIVLMIFVNYGGGKFYFFRHSRWNGLTVADLVFPWFLWIMGVSLVFSLRSQMEKNVPYKVILWRITCRSLVLFTLGTIVNSIKSNYLPTFRIPGVLQRFAVCYLLNATIEMFYLNFESSRLAIVSDLVGSLIQWSIIGIVAMISTILTFTLPVPGCPTGYLGPGGVHMNGSYPNCTGGAANYVDQAIFGPLHIHKTPSCKSIYDNEGPYDPEGLLGTLMACLTVQLGVAAGRILFYHSNHMSRILRWIIWAIILGFVSGCLCGFTKEGGPIPVNKNLWSLSYTFVTASFAFILLAFLYYVIDVRKKWNGSFLRSCGMNAILLYMGHEFTGRVFPFSWSPVGEQHTDHLLMNLTGTSLWILIAAVCHSKKLYISV